MLTAADTAYAIAKVRAEEGARPPGERLFADPYAATFAAAGAHAEEGIRRFFDLPFFVEGVRLRTRAIDDAVLEGFAAGLETLVLLGAGFDSRALRLGDHRAFELDFGELLAKKRALLGEVPARIAYVACDFRTEDFASKVPLVPSMIVWEGVTAYLDESAIDRTLEAVKRFGTGTRLVFDDRHPDFAVENVASRARRFGFETTEVGFDELWGRYLPGEPHPAASVARLTTARVR